MPGMVLLILCSVGSIRRYLVS